MVAAVGPRVPGRALQPGQKKRIAEQLERTRNDPWQIASTQIMKDLLVPDLSTNEGRISAALTFVPGGKIATGVKAGVSGFKAARAAMAAGKAVSTATKAATTGSKALKATTTGVRATKAGATTSTATRTTKSAAMGGKTTAATPKGASMPIPNPVQILKATGAGLKAGAKAAVTPTSKAGKAIASGATKAGKTVKTKAGGAGSAYSRTVILRPSERVAYTGAKAARDEAAARFIKSGGKNYKGKAQDLKTIENFNASQKRVNQLGRRNAIATGSLAGGAAATGVGIGMAQSRRTPSASIPRPRGGVGQGALTGSNGFGFSSRPRTAAARPAASGPGAPMGSRPSKPSSSGRTSGVTRRAAAPKMAKGPAVSQSRTQWVRKGDVVNGQVVTKGYLAQYGKPGKRVTANVRIETPSAGKYTAGGGGQMAGGTKKGEVYAYKGGRRTGAMKKK